jgi:hypothetical protein
VVLLTVEVVTSPLTLVSVTIASDVEVA